MNRHLIPREAILESLNWHPDTSRLSVFNEKCRHLNWFWIHQQLFRRKPDWITPVKSNDNTECYLCGNTNPSLTNKLTGSPPLLTVAHSVAILLRFVPIDPNHNIPALLLVIAWHLRGNKPLPEPVMTRVIGAYMRHQAATCLMCVRNICRSSWNNCVNRCWLGVWRVLHSIIFSCFLYSADTSSAKRLCFVLCCQSYHQ